MRDAQQILDATYLEMRWRCLSLAADFDRVQRASGGTAVLQSDPRLKMLKQAIQTLIDECPGRAERVQMLFSDRTPPPDRKSKH